MMIDDDLLDDPSLQNDDLPSDGQARTIANLAREQEDAEAEVVAATERLQTALARYRQVAEVDLPAALRAAGTSALTTTSGGTVKLVTDYDATQLENPEGLRWYEEHGGSSLIKTAVLVELDRGDLPAAREIMQLLRDSRHANKFRTLKLTESVHPQTNGAFVRRMIAQHKDPPFDVLGVHPRTYAVVGDKPKRVELKGFVKR